MMISPLWQVIFFNAYCGIGDEKEWSERKSMSDKKR
jgi:hypothetical protein